MAAFVYKNTCEVEKENAILNFVELKAAINYTYWKPLWN